MTDNEKRAHDLAIIVCADICRLKIQSQISNKENEVIVDYFQEYLNAYNSILESFNNKFPNEK